MGRLECRVITNDGFFCGICSAETSYRFGEEVVQTSEQKRLEQEIAEYNLPNVCNLHFLHYSLDSISSDFFLILIDYVGDNSHLKGLFCCGGALDLCYCSYVWVWLWLFGRIYGPEAGCLLLSCHRVRKRTGFSAGLF